MNRGKIISFLLLMVCIQTLAQTAQEEFGQNRVQYRHFEWSYFQSERFAVYFYLGGQDLGKFTIVDAEQELNEVELQMEYKMDDRIEILVFNNLADLKQSNIGYGIDLNNTGGITKIIGNKMFIYFDGNHQHLRRQIREGIAGIFLSYMMFGGNLQEVVQNAVLLNLPDWYTEGLISFVGESWSTELDNRFRDGILSGRYKEFNKLSGSDARFAGHSVWHYIAIKYGDASIPNLLYLTRINRNMEAGFNFSFGKTSKEFLEEWYNYYFYLYSQEAIAKTVPSENEVVKNKLPKGMIFNQFRINSTATHLSFVRNDIGKFKVCLRNIESGKNSTVIRGGFRNITQPIDYTQPLLDFDPTGNKLAVIYEKRDKTMLLTYDFLEKKKEKREITNFQKVLSMAFVDPNQLVLSAESKGQSDIFLYGIKGASVQQITNDYYDDLNAAFIKLNNRQGILFASNRMNDTLRNQSMDTLLPIGNYDIFFYNTKKKSKELLRVTSSPGTQESAPASFNNQYFSFLSDQNGISNRFVAYIDSYLHHYDHYFFFKDSTVINPGYNMDSLISIGQLIPDSTMQWPVYKDTAHTFPFSNYATGILEQNLAMKARKMGQLMLHNGSFEYSLIQVPDSINLSQLPALVNTSYATELKSKYQEEEPEISELKDSIESENNLPVDSAKDDTTKVSYFFQSEFSEDPPTILPEEEVLLNKKSVKLKFSRILPYTVRFSTAYVVTQLDNSIMVTRYQPFNGNGSTFNNPDLNGMMRVGITDIMEDYRFSGGFRFPTTFSGTEYYGMFEDLKHRLDKRYTFYRKSENVAYDAQPVWYLPVNGKLRSYLVDATLRYPIDFTKSIRLGITYRDERVKYLATDSFSLELEPYNERWAVVHGEYVFDNTLKIQPNILYGSRYKIYLDAQRQVNEKNSYLFAAGVDFRHYQKISRNLIWATRLNAATSWGDQKVVYFLGGTENWIANPETRFNTETLVDPDAGYSFQALATHLRGFNQNIRNGNSFALLNTEIRFPVFSYLFRSPIRSEMVNNFQLVAFGDGGTAWQGISPYDEDNPFNSSTVVQGPITVNVNYFREPVVFGYGIGARTTFLGYFVRLDYAQGVDSGVAKKPRFYFSLGLDF